MPSKQKAVRFLKPAEEAVFDVIVKQRNDNINEEGKDRGDVFRYDEDKGQALLNQNGAADKYGIGQDEQLEILRSFRDRGLIKVEWTVSHPHGWPVLAHRHSKWAEEELMVYYYPYEDDDHQELYFVNVSHRRIKLIRDHLIKRRKAKLVFDEESNRFVVEVDDGEKYIIRKLKRKMLAFEVLKIAVTMPGEIIFRDDINEGIYGNTVKIGKMSIATQVFDDNSIVRNELSPFIEGEMTSESLCVVKDGLTELTQAQIDVIERISF